MTEASFLQQQKGLSPSGLAIVIALHAAGLTAVVFAKGPDVIRRVITRTIVYDVPPEKAPPPVEKIKPAETKVPPIFVPPTVVETPIHTPPVFEFDTLPPRPPEIAWGRVDPPQPPLRIEPVRTQAEFDQRFADRLKPPYPAPEQRDGIEGRVTLSVLIGTDGRVKSVERVSATTDNFFRAAERQALAYWRFKPATVDGKPIESRKQMTLKFQLDA